MKLTQEPLIQTNVSEETGSRKLNGITVTGYILLIISFAVYLITEYAIEQPGEDKLSIFVFHYVLALIYAGVLLYHKAFGVVRSWSRSNLPYTVILLLLFLISAYALNREIPVFEESTEWLSVFLVLISVTLLTFQFYQKLPYSIKLLLHFVTGIGACLFLYMIFFVSFLYPAGFIGLLFLGIGGHIFVPITLFNACVLLVKNNPVNSRFRYGFVIAGFVCAALYAVAFVTEWYLRGAEIDKMNHQSVLYREAELPLWTRVAETLPNDWITERIIKSDLVYTVFKNNSGWQFFPDRLMWEEKRKHDPFAFLASLVKESSLTRDERIKILQALSTSGKRANERLWSGDNLSTSYIVSDIDIYPDLRLAYTEKYLSIRNNNINQGWRGNTEEAIYTFQLPEGSVVTSLSLWVNGKEEKAILTSKQKADTAYKTIVGVERRDPSVVHWQEGNSVSVRVFPCTPFEERKFKIGITSPLAVVEDQTVYRPVTFQGPSASAATETIRVRFVGDSSKVELSGFKLDKNGDQVIEHDFDPDFEFSFKTMPLKTNNTFSFDGYAYSLSDYHEQLREFSAQKVYLDINNSWTNSELLSLRSLLTKKEIWVCADETFTQLNNENWDKTTKELQKRNFSLFPFHHLKINEHALVITKGKRRGIHLNDIAESQFAKELESFFVRDTNPYVFNLGSEVSPYIGSLRELRAIEFAEGDVKKIIDWIDSDRFSISKESDERVILHDANLVLSRHRVAGELKVNNAPDHLARLFAYNDIMRRIGPDFFSKDFIREDLVKQAQAAYVVSPVSSLIVLESQEDYKRFKIEDAEKSLQNATKQSSGAVPEPHEWALIILLVLVVLYSLKNQLTRKFLLERVNKFCN